MGPAYTDGLLRSGLAEALARIAAGEASVLVVARLGSVAGSLHDLVALLDWLVLAGPSSWRSTLAWNVVGSLLAYGVGATGALERVPGARRILRRWEGLLDRHGLRAVFLARLLPLARTFVSLPAGARRVPLLPFIALTTIGCALWATMFVLAGLIAGAAWTSVSAIAGRALLALGGLTLVLSLVRGRRPS